MDDNVDDNVIEFPRSIQALTCPCEGNTWYVDRFEKDLGQIVCTSCGHPGPGIVSLLSRDDIISISGDPEEGLGYTSDDEY